MGRTKEKILELTREKEDSIRMADKIVMDELLEMGFNYNHIGTHYLHDSIVCSLFMDSYKYGGNYVFCLKIRDKMCRKYKVNGNTYSVDVYHSIESAFRNGNIDYIMETFKNSCDKDKMVVGKNTFIMTVRRKLIRILKEQENYNATQLRLIIQGSVEKITDYNLLRGICDIVLSVGDKEFA